MGQFITLQPRGHGEIRAWRADPAGAPKGGIVVLQEVFGVNPHIRSVADRFAAAGYLAIAPALFDPVEPNVELGYSAETIQTGLGLVGRLNMDEVLADVAAAAAVAGEAGKVAAVGFCWGGTVAFLAAAREGSGLSAAVAYYGGGIAKALDDRPKVPMIFHFGAQDAHIPAADVDKVRAANPDSPVYTYDADHGFNCDARASYDAPAAEAAMARTLAFLDETIG